MENGTFAPHNIFKNLTFLRHPKALVWSKGLRSSLIHTVCFHDRVVWSAFEYINQTTFEPVSSIRYKLACLYSEDLNLTV